MLVGTFLVCFIVTRNHGVSLPVTTRYVKRLFPDGGVIGRQSDGPKIGSLDKTVNDRNHLSARKIERLLENVRGSRNETRDRCLVLLTFRYGLRVSEACGLALEQVDVESRVLHVARLKGGLFTTHPLRGDEIRAIKAWLVERARMKAPGRSFFLSERRKPLHRSTVNLLLHKYGEKARLPVAVHPHMLRHACGFALADQGADTRPIQDYLGHHNIQHTVRYTATNPARFEKLWR